MAEMDDKQLLEMAARAAGMSGTCVDYDDRLVFLEDGKPASVEWNPLTDDGDALRLAVKLGIWVHPDRHTNEAIGHKAVYERHDGVDSGAAMRRAITRAAAEIARAAASIGKERTTP